MIALAVAATDTAVATKVVGVSANGYITAIVGVIVSFMGAGGLYGIFKGLAFMAEQKNNRAKIDNDAATVVRREMMEFNEKLQTRIDKLEETGRDDRKRFDEEMANVRRLHAEEVIAVRKGYEGEIRDLREEIVGLRRQMAQWQSTSGTAQSLSERAPTAAMKRVDASGMGGILREAFDVPGVGEDGSNR